MAYAALNSLLRTLDQIPQPVQQIKFLQEKVTRLLVILEDFSRKSSLSISHLEGQIRDASYEAEDIIESHKAREVVPRSISCGVISSCFWEMISSMIPSINLREEFIEFQGLEKIINDFDSILEALSKMKERKTEDLGPKKTLKAAGSSRIEESTLVGLDEDLVQIKDRLTGWPSKLEVISIVGMGGIGKTSLARNLYNDSLIKYHFHVRAWVVVSQDYYLQQIFSGLLDSIRDVADGDLYQKSTEQLAEVLYKSLKGRRYLIVMDDVWDTKAWDGVRRFLPDDNNGSRIIVTTRLSEVATHANSDRSIHRMDLLSPEASWNLLREKVFGKECCPSALENIGKKIARSCKGLPLAIILISRLLSKSSRKQHYWKYIARHVKLAVTGNDDDRFMEILSLSYNSLPQRLKACFLYMGVFPQDHVIFVSQLIKLWIAEGFVEPLPYKSLENVAEDYLKNLIDRSLIMVHKKNHHGGIKTCIMHDMLRELCVKKAQEEELFQIMKWDTGIFPQGTKSQRRVSIHSNNLAHLTCIHDSSVCTLVYFCNDLFISMPWSFRLLRVLDVLTIWFYEFPDEILELVYLRYLAFIHRGKKKFPASISKLRNLQTLIVYRGKYFISIVRDDSLYLPSSIWEMPQLRHLSLDKSFLPTPIVGKDSVVVLQNLQTLSEVTDFKCTRKVFEMMPNLKKLGTSYYYDNHTNWSSYEFNNFVYLHQLETLKCLFFPKFILDAHPLGVEFAFPRNLKKLTLSGCGISWTEMTVVGTLPNLEVLKLKNNAFRGIVWEPNEGEFSKLKFLLMHNIPLKHWRARETHFPNLEHLSLSFCSNLLEIPSEIGEIPTLEMLELYECSPSAIVSAMLIQEEQRILENDSLTVRINSFRDHYYSNLNTSLRKDQGAFIIS